MLLTTRDTHPPPRQRAAPRKSGSKAAAFQEPWAPLLRPVSYELNLHQDTLATKALTNNDPTNSPPQISFSLPTDQPIMIASGSDILRALKSSTLVTSSISP